MSCCGEKLVEEVCRKREFSKLPSPVVLRALEKSGNDVSKARAILRKYFGVFLTKRVLKSGDEGVLKRHYSTKGRDFEKFYGEIFEGLWDFKSVFDVGCGVCGFSYPFLKNVVGEVEYLGIEAAGQLVFSCNKFFEKNRFLKCRVFQGDVFDKDFVLNKFSSLKSPRAVFMFQVIDAMEFFKKDFSKEFIFSLLQKGSRRDVVAVSFALRSLGGRKFSVSRKWIVDFLKDKSEILKDFECGSERVIVFRKKL